MDSVFYFLKEHPQDWKYFFIPRHHKFIDAFIHSNGDINWVAEKFQYHPKDMLSIFRRIEKQIQHVFPNISDPSQRKILLHILSVVNHSPQKKEKLPPRLLEIISALQQVPNIHLVSDHLQLNQRYVLSRLLGRKKPRKPCEQGAMFYLQSQ